jgi:NAD(P)H-flavin reductase
MTEMEKSKRSWRGETGNVDKAMIARLIPELREPIYYVAGPPAMASAMQKTFVDARVNEDNIRSEDFAGY